MSNYKPKTAILNPWLINTFVPGKPYWIVLFGAILMGSFCNGQNIDFCYDFNNYPASANPSNPLDNWQGIAGDFAYSNLSSQNGSNDIYLRANDRSGSSWAYNTVDFAGDWSNTQGNKCLCYDFRIFAGADNVTIAPTSMFIFNGASPDNFNSRARFVLTSGLSIEDGWATICPPMKLSDGNGNLPSNSDGKWEMDGAGTATDWDNLVQNVSGLALRLDLPGTSNPSEIYGYDNICVESCPKPYPSYTFDPCCPPINKNSLADLFNHVPTGSITDPYNIEFSPTLAFTNQMQAYIDYLNVINPSISNLYYTWRLFDMGTGISPLTSFSGAGQIGNDVFNNFEPGGTSMIGNTNFFPNTLEINHWYKVHVGLYLNDKIEFFDGRECAQDTWFTFNYKFENQRLIGEIKDANGKVLKLSEVLVPKRKNSIISVKQLPKQKVRKN